jgi:UPF0042 nucleotide-binding protein
VVITGLSGSGKSTAIRALEDLDYFCVDNLPVVLLPKFLELAQVAGRPLDHVGLVVDVRERQFLAVADQVLTSVRERGHSVEVVFLSAEDETLVRRFTETRRKHPLSAGNVLEGIQAERELLEDLQAMAGHTIDTTKLTVHALRSRIQSEFDPQRSDGGRMAVNVVSFGFRRGAPRNADLVFDVRFLPNPHYVQTLRDMTGEDAAVAEYVLGQDETGEFLGHLQRLLAFLLPRYEAEGKSYLTIAIGCTGGQHRSVAISIEVAGWIRALPHEVAIQHRDIPQ